MYERSNSVVNLALYIDSRRDSGELPASALPLTLQEFPLFTGFNTIDPGVSAAAMTGIENNDMMPIIKEELKNRIHFKRMVEEKELLMADFPEKPKVELTDVEKERVERRRGQNRMAARRFREKEKTLEAKLQKTTQKLESDNTSLRTLIRELRREREILRRQLQGHLYACPYANESYMQQCLPS